MNASDHDQWDPLPLADVIDVFRDAPFRWWIVGGHALELHTGRSWRDHADLDIGVSRIDLDSLWTVLRPRDPHIAARGALTPWTGGTLDPAAHQNGLWCRTAPDNPWRFEVLVDDSTRTEWIYRRDPAVRRPWGEAVLTTADGVPYLAPELTLLFKSKHVREKDTIDAVEVIPALTPAQQHNLAALLPSGHSWRTIIPGELPPQHNTEKRNQ
jgi:Aminoglycoside-2''-adenylyltransferase